MDKSEIDNPIIIIGGDHHNTLAVIRDLGRHKCDIFVLVHTNSTNKKTSEFRILNMLRIR